jgi:SAM-dependent methyltransferase
VDGPEPEITKNGVFDIIRENLKRAQSFLKRALRKVLGKGGLPDGMQFYRPGRRGELNAGFQTYYRENADKITKGEVPARYLRIAKLVPGERVLEIGSADGTQSLVLARSKSLVCGVELMPMQFEEACELRKKWIKNGEDVERCEFRNEDVLTSTIDLDGFDTVLMSRVLYHFRDSADAVLEKIAQSKVNNIVLVGCPIRERNWREHGVSGDVMGKYASLASQEGMESVLHEHDFHIVSSFSSEKGDDPIVVASRNL